MLVVMSDETPRPVPEGSRYAPTAIPSRLARGLAFTAIVVAGICGGIIGYALVDLQCSGECTVQKGLAAVGGSLIGAFGVAIVATLAMRAMGEWRDIQHTQTAQSNGSGRPTSHPNRRRR